MSRKIAIIAGMLLINMVLHAATSVVIGNVSQEVILGEPVEFTIQVKTDNRDADIDVSDVKLDGEPLKYRSSSQTSFSQTFVNGKVKVENTIVTNFIFQVPTTKVGPISLGPYKIKVDGVTYPVTRVTSRVSPQPVSPNLKFDVSVLNPQKSYYPSQIIEIECKILWRNLPELTGANFVVPILNDNGFELIPAKNPNGQLSVNGQVIPVFRQEAKQTLGGQEYSTLFFKLSLQAMTPGHYRYKNTLQVRYWTGRVQRTGRGFFTQEQKEEQNLYAGGPDLNIEVKELPRENVPSTFNGAIGNFTIKVIPSSDTDIRVGDPITLVIEIHGHGTWEFVKCPPIHKLPEISDYFKISDDPVLGEVSKDQTSKSFKVRMRVNSRTVTRIPPIPITFFDVIEAKYKTVYSESIPITVYEAGGKTQIVDYTHLQPESPQTIEPLKPPAEEVKTGEEALELVVPEPIEITDNVDAAMLTADHATPYHWLIFAMLPFVGVLVALIGKAISQAAPSPEKIRKQKARRAYATFVANTADLGTQSEGFYRELGRSIRTFVADKFQLDSPNIDDELIKTLTGRLDAEKGARLLKLVDEIDQHRYSFDAFDPVHAKELLNRSRELLKSC